MKALILKALAPFLNSRLRPFLLSWKTSLAGVGLLAAALAQTTQAALAVADGGDIDADTWASIAAQAVAGWGFLVGKDADKTGDGATFLAKGPMQLTTAQEEALLNEAKRKVGGYSRGQGTGDGEQV